MFSILPEIRIYAVYNNLKHVLLPMMSGMAVFLNSLINISKYTFIRNFMAVYTVKFFINYISTFSCEGLVRLKWAIAVKIRYPPVDDTVFGNENTVGNPHSSPCKVLEIQTRIVKLYGKSVKIA